MTLRDKYNSLLLKTTLRRIFNSIVSYFNINSLSIIIICFSCY
uniref:Uncharacterized protein n=1 Tax=Amphimedon queenslandica TaxID=400682 RepID=A0A1X7TR91_AMPQE